MPRGGIERDCNSSFVIVSCSDVLVDSPILGPGLWAFFVSLVVQL